MVCPECMSQQRASAPRVRSTPGWVRTLTHRDAPVVTYGIIALCILVYIAQILPGVGTWVTQHLQYAGVYSYPIVFQPWRMLTSVFAHYSILHIGLNMYTLFIFGMVLEPQLGRLRFAALFLISGFAGSLGVMFLASPLTAVIGASGGIFGLFGALFIIQRRLGFGSTQILILIAINLVIGFIPGLGIAWQAHVGGVIAGVIVGLIYVETRRESRRKWQFPLIVAFCLLLVLASLIHVL